MFCAAWVTRCAVSACVWTEKMPPVDLSPDQAREGGGVGNCSAMRECKTSKKENTDGKTRTLQKAGAGRARGKEPTGRDWCHPRRRLYVWFCSKALGCVRCDRWMGMASGDTKEGGKRARGRGREGETL